MNSGNGQNVSSFVKKYRISKYGVWGIVTDEKFNTSVKFWIVGLLFPIMT